MQKFDSLAFNIFFLLNTRYKTEENNVKVFYYNCVIIAL